MRKPALVVLTFLLIAPATCSAEEGPIGYWSFDLGTFEGGRLKDLSGSGCNGIIHGASSIRDEGAVNRALYFDGSGDYVEIFDPNNIYSGMGRFSVSFWVKKLEYRSEVYLYKGSGLWDAWSFRSQGRGVYGFIRNKSGDTKRKPQRSTVLNRFRDYVHYAFTYDGSRCRQYVQGVLVVVDDCPPGGLISKEGSLFLGKGDQGLGDFKGYIDELKIFNRVLSRNEIREEAEKNIHCGNGICESLETYLTCWEDCGDSSLAGTLSENPDYTVWTADALLKVLPSFRPPESGLDAAGLDIARNEIRFVQLAVTPKTDTEIEVSVKDPGGLEVGLYSEGVVDISRPSNTKYYLGPVPDPLLEGGSLTLESGETQAILVEVSTNHETAPGEHAVTIGIGNQDIPIRVSVYDFSLPDEVTLKTAFDAGQFDRRYGDGCQSLSVLDFHGVSKSDTESFDRVAAAYYDDYAENRIVPYKPHRRSPYTYDCYTQKFDFTEFDADLEHYLDGLNMNAAMINSINRERLFEICGYNLGDSQYEGIAKDYFSELSSHLQDKGWLEKAYFMVDEPQADHFSGVSGLADIMVDEVEPPLKIGPALNNEEGYEALDGHVNLWVLFNDDLKSVYDHSKAEERSDRGDEIWWYYTDTDHFNIDSEAIDHMIFPWQAWKYDISGVLTWAGILYDMHCRESKGYGYTNPWHDPRSYWGNGQINFYYPPCVEPCTNPTFDVVPSLRVKLFREGIQDYEYLTMLDDRIKAADGLGIDTGPARAALGRLDGLELSFNTWGRNASLLLEVRRHVAEQIESLEESLYRPCCMADTEAPYGSVKTEELVNFISLWYKDSTNYPITELAAALAAWKEGLETQ